MQFSVTCRGTKITPAIRDYVQEKALKLEEFFNSIQKVEVVLEATSNANADKRQDAEIRAWLAGKKVIQAKADARDVYAAFDLALDEAKRQIRQHKEKMVKEHRRKAGKEKQELFSSLEINPSNQPDIGL